MRRGGLPRTVIMTFSWPDGFPRLPDADWTTKPVEELALGYDTVEEHGWYDNLDPTVDQLEALLDGGEIVVDYSGGTGILVDRLLQRLPDLPFGVLLVDASKKFLRLSIDKLGHEDRVAFRHLAYLKDEGRVLTLQEVLEQPLLDRGVELLVSTNAIHLYYGLDGTLASWYELLNPGGRVLVQSGNIGLPDPTDERWIIDETVAAIAEAAEGIVARDDAYAAYRSVLGDEERMAAYRRLREKFFLPVRPLDHYLGALENAEFEIEEVTHREITAQVEEWYEFLSVYHEGVLGWVGGSQRVEGKPPTEEDVATRKQLIRRAMDEVFGGKEAFQAVWTYLTCHRQ